jgi:hypothetical protein
MYDVIYIDEQGDETCLAKHLADRRDATVIAREAATERKAGRMVLPGSNKPMHCVCVVPCPEDGGDLATAA